MGNYISNSLVPTLRMEMVLEKDFKILDMVNKSIVKVQGYVSLRLDSGEVNFRVIGQVFPNLRSEVMLGTPWLMKENPIIE